MTRNKWREAVLGRQADEMLAAIVKANRVWRQAQRMGFRRVIMANGRSVRVVPVAMTRGL